MKHFLCGLASLLIVLAAATNVLGLVVGQEPQDSDWLDHFHPSLHQFVLSFQGLGEGVEGASQQPPTPEEMIRSFSLSDGLTVDVIASEPIVQQPLNLHFDERGRLWVVQYIQYPFPAGLQVLSYDRYLRAVYDRVPPPPPNHDRGRDRIAILEDRDGDGQYESHRIFLDGLNMVSSLAVGRGGVWVLNPPYLLFYPDEDRDDIPDRAPDVRLSGFGIEDTHAVANSLRWGPDGWLYGVQGSTTSAEIRGQKFLGQAVWRYHPDLDEFEVFSEGGGNTWSLTFDSQGRAFSGTNNGGTRGLHYYQGAYYVKNFSKHGPLTEPFAFGYLSHMEHSGYQPRFAQTFEICEGGRLPSLEGQVVAGMSLTNRVQASRLIPEGSTFRTVDTPPLVTTENKWFRPVDLKLGPDGYLYLADWTDFRLSHLNPQDNWEKRSGRIFRLRSVDWSPIPSFDLAKLETHELLEYLTHENRWFRQQARRVLGDRKDRSVLPQLIGWVESRTDQLALEALWASNLCGGFTPSFALKQLDHPNPHVRLWTIRLMGDRGAITADIRSKLVQMARDETNLEVRAQLLCSLRRLPQEDSLPILKEVLLTEKSTADPQIPLLTWWALEDLIDADSHSALQLLEDPAIWETTLMREHLASRVGRRFAADRGEMYYQFSEDYSAVYSGWQSTFDLQECFQNLDAIRRLLEVSPAVTDSSLISGLNQGLGRVTLDVVPVELQSILSERLDGNGATEDLIANIRLGVENGVGAGIERLGTTAQSTSETIRLVQALVDRKATAAIPRILDLLRESESTELRTQLAIELSNFQQIRIAETLTEIYPSAEPPVQATIRSVLLDRAPWSEIFLSEIVRTEDLAESLTQEDLDKIAAMSDPDLNRFLSDIRRKNRKDGSSKSMSPLLEEGENVYFGNCGYCHLDSGEGMATSLVNSRWVLGPEEALIQIVLHGKASQDMAMPPFAEMLTNRQLAAVLTWIRSHWENDAAPITPERVAEIRDKTEDRSEPFTEEELEKLIRPAH